VGGRYRRCEDDLAMRRFDVRMHVRSGDEERRGKRMATSRPRARKKKQIKPKGSEKKRERRRSGS